jgi:hypothetical protein
LSKRKPQQTRRGRQRVHQERIIEAAERRDIAPGELIVRLIRREFSPAEQAELLREIGPETIDELFAYAKELRVLADLARD